MISDFALILATLPSEIRDRAEPLQRRLIYFFVRFFLRDWF